MDKLYWGQGLFKGLTPEQLRANQIFDSMELISAQFTSKEGRLFHLDFSNSPPYPRITLAHFDEDEPPHADKRSVFVKETGKDLLYHLFIHDGINVLEYRGLPSPEKIAQSRLEDFYRVEEIITRETKAKKMRFVSGLHSMIQREMVIRGGWTKERIADYIEALGRHFTDIKIPEVFFHDLDLNQLNRSGLECTLNPNI